MKKLNLGCGSILLDGYINIDLYNPSAEVQHDLTKPLPYKDGSIDEIYAKHIIEHFLLDEWLQIKKDWSRILKKGGKLTIECPDITKCMEHFLNNFGGDRWGFWLCSIYGLQHGNPGQIHKNGFDVERLSQNLEDEGFKVESVERLWYNTPDPINGFNIKLIAIKE
jgi:hypothetical protein